jgi:sigma-B regulation protein RsbU (phosphoserine phosphatase)
LRLSIRWKLLLAVGLPALLIYSFVVVAGAHRLRVRGLERMEENAQRLAVFHSERLDAEFSIFAQTARVTAAILEFPAACDASRLEGLLQRNVEDIHLIVGSCALLEPDEQLTGVTRAAPCVFAQNGISRTFELSDESGPTDIREQEWFKEARAAGSEAWSEPYRRSESDPETVVTFATPVHQSGRLAGFVTVDVSLEEIREHLGAVQFVEGELAILGPSGAVVTYPEEGTVIDDTLFRLAQRGDRPDLAELLGRMTSGEVDVEHLPMPAGIGAQWILYAPIRGTGWTFAASLPESQVLAFSNSQLRWGLVFTVAGLVLILSVLLVVVTRMTGRLSHLCAAVGELSRGNLDVQVTEVDTQDEVGRLARAFNRMTTDLKAHVETRAKETAAREAVESELRVARNIQTSLLPQRYPPFPAHREFDLHAISLPARPVGGDFFDYFFLTNDTLVLLMADVSGKGIPAALFMAVARTVLRDLSPGSPSPAATLTRANRALSEDNVGSMFVTMFLGWYNIRTGSLRYANAGHPLPYRIGASGEVEQSGTVTGPVLGILDGEQYREGQLDVGIGERLVLYTDGIPEAIAPSGDFFGEERFAEILRQSTADPAERLLQKVAVKVESFQDHALQDDITLLLLQRNS